MFNQPKIAIIMGSKSDWSTMKKAADVLDLFGIAYEKKVSTSARAANLAIAAVSSYLATICSATSEAGQFGSGSRVITLCPI